MACLETDKMSFSWLKPKAELHQTGNFEGRTADWQRC